MKHLILGAVLLGLATPAFASAPDNYAESTAAFVPGMPTGIDPARIQMSPESTAPHPLVYEAPDHAIVLSSGGLSTHFLLGVKVTDEKGGPVGTIDNLVFNKDGVVKQAILSVGGFMGFDARKVSVPFRSLSISGESHKDPTARSDATFADMKKLPTFVASKLPAGDILATHLLGTKLAPQDAGNQAVKLTDIIIDPDGSSQYAAVEYGGIDGFGAKRTVVEYSTLGSLTAKPAIPLNLKMAILRKAQPFVYTANGSTTSIPEMFDD